MFKAFLKYYRTYQGLFWGVMLASIVSSLLDLVFPMLVRQILNVELPNKDMAGLMNKALILLGLYFFNFFLMYGMNYFGHKLSASIQRDMRHDLYSHMEKLSFKFFDNNKTGQLLNRITSDIAEISELTFKGPNDLLVCSITMIGVFGMLVYMNPRLGVIISIMLAVKAINAVYVNRKMKAAFKRSREKSGELAAAAEEGLSGIRLVKAFAREEMELNRFDEKSQALYETRLASFNLLCYFASSINFFTNVTNIMILTYGGYMIYNGELAFSDFVAFLLYVNLFMKPIFRLTILTEMYQRGMAGYNRFYEIMSTKPEIEDGPKAITSGEIKGSIVFENMTFGYIEGRDVLKNFNLEIKPGQKVAFVGATGVGKTTLASLLLRFYEPQKGRILVDGVDIKDYGQQYLRSQIGMVQQDVFLFSESVSYNISYGKAKATQEEIVTAAKLAAADDFIKALPEGYDTCIGERGVKLSGGQKQRLAIARAFLKNPPILVLDEATSSLDMKTEKLIQASLDKLTTNRTTLIIAHRLSTIVNADVIVVIKDGQIVEQGKHEELMALDGIYKKLYTLKNEE